MDLLGMGPAVSGERGHSFIPNASEPLPLSSWCFRLPHSEGRGGSPTAMEPSSSRLMCPWSFVKAGYLLLQSNCSSPGAAQLRTHCYEKSGVSLAMKHCQLPRGGRFLLKRRFVWAQRFRRGDVKTASLQKHKYSVSVYPPKKNKDSYPRQLKSHVHTMSIIPADPVQKVV